MFELKAVNVLLKRFDLPLQFGSIRNWWQIVLTFHGCGCLTTE